MQRLLFILIAALIASCSGKRHLQSGPMNGYATHTEAMVWVQSKKPANIHLVYTDSLGKKIGKTEKCQSLDEDACVCKFKVPLEPGNKYSYKVYINKRQVKLPYKPVVQSQELWQWRTDPPEFNFAIGSCNYVNEPEYDRPGKAYGQNHHIFQTIDSLHPDFMLWMGDNTYLREVDWNTRNGMIHRYTHTRSLPQIQQLLARTHHYAIWDDHDFGPDNSDRSFPLRHTALELFQLFWANQNYGAGGGISGSFEWQDVQFFLLDNRSFKSPNNLNIENKSLLGDEQLQWLIEALSVSKASFKFVVMGGQVLNPVITDWSENYAKYPLEQQKLMASIREHNIGGVFFLSGDRHHTELSKMEREGTYPIYDLTVSPLTAGAVGDRALNEANTHRVEGTYYGQHNFAAMNISGPRTDRVLRISVHNADGAMVWSKEIKSSELK